MKYILAILIAIAPSLVLADTYQLSVNWKDTTVASQYYVPAYNLEYRIGDAPWEAVSDLPAPAFTKTITAPPNTRIAIKVQNKNTLGPLFSAWSLPIQEYTPYGSTPPNAPSGFTMTITHVSNP